MSKFLTQVKGYALLLVSVVILLFCAVQLISCSSKKTLVKEDSSKVVELSNLSQKTLVHTGVSDTLRLVLPRLKTGDLRCDSLAQLYLDNQPAIFSKTKGDKSLLNIAYEPSKGTLTAIAQIEELTDRIDSEKVEKSAIISKNQECQFQYPLWIKVLAFIGFLTLVFIAWRISRIFL